MNKNIAQNVRALLQQIQFHAEAREDLKKKSDQHRAQGIADRHALAGLMQSEGLSAIRSGGLLVRYDPAEFDGDGLNIQADDYADLSVE